MKSMGEIKNDKLSVEFTDGQLLMIAKLYTQITNNICDPLKIAQYQIDMVIDYLSKQTGTTKDGIG